MMIEPLVVDTCVILDIFFNDPIFGVSCARYLDGLRAEGQRLAVAPVTVVELSPSFTGDLQEQKRFLDTLGVAYNEPWTLADTEAAHLAWAAYINWRRGEKTKPPRDQTAKRPIADVLIGGFASRRGGIVTRDPKHYRRWFPKLDIRIPAKSTP